MDDVAFFPLRRAIFFCGGGAGVEWMGWAAEGAGDAARLRPCCLAGVLAAPVEAAAATAGAVLVAGAAAGLLAAEASTALALRLPLPAEAGWDAAADAD